VGCELKSGELIFEIAYLEKCVINLWRAKQGAAKVTFQHCLGLIFLIHELSPIERGVQLPQYAKVFQISRTD
jgi:hypothetical protein